MENDIFTQQDDLFILQVILFRLLQMKLDIDLKNVVKFLINMNFMITSKLVMNFFMYKEMMQI